MRVNAIGGVCPECAVGSHERIDLSLSQLESLVAQSDQGCARITQKAEPIIFVGEQPADNPLNRFLRHVGMRDTSAPLAPSAGQYLYRVTGLAKEVPLVMDKKTAPVTGVRGADASTLITSTHASSIRAQ